MKAEIITLTPELAKELLKNNVGNRKLTNYKNHYSMLMASGLWKENGEPIIVDSNGFVKDGQHRLNACIIANHSFKVPLITGVDPDVMDTIDTGKNRSLSDVLELNGFSHSNELGSVIKTVLKIENGLSISRSGNDKFTVPNSVGLKYAQENMQSLTDFLKVIRKIKTSQNVTLLTFQEICAFYYELNGFIINDTVIRFISGIVGSPPNADSATYYGYKKLLDANVNKVKMSTVYKHNLIVKLWNTYITNDTPITKLVISQQEYETPKKLTI